VPTLYLIDWQRENAAQANLPDFTRRKMEMVSEMGKRNAKKAFEAGVKIGFGTDAAVYPHGLNAHEFAVYVKLGMTPLQAIQTATITTPTCSAGPTRSGRLSRGSGPTWLRWMAIRWQTLPRWNE